MTGIEKLAFGLFLAGTIVAVVASLMGWFAVLRRQAFAAHTLALVGFPGAHPAFTPADMASKEAFAGGVLIGLQGQAPAKRS